MQNDAWFFIGIFVFIFLIWVATGGPSHPISFAGPFLSQPAPLGSGTYIGLPHANFGIGNSSVVLGNSQYSGSSYSGGNVTATTTVDGIAFGPPSPYRGEVEIQHYVSGAGATNPENEYVEISVSSDSAPVDLTGWTLLSEASGNEAEIPQGTEIPGSGVIEPINDITLQPGDEAIVTSGIAPIGASFKENKCIGYFGEFQYFSPSLPDSCPSAENEMENYYPDYVRDLACINYTSELSNCTIAANYPPDLSSSCTNFLNQYINYNGCVEAHKGDANFETNVWRIYLGRAQAMWRPSHDVVKLIDPEGRTVDAFAY